MTLIPRTFIIGISALLGTILLIASTAQSSPRALHAQAAADQKPQAPAPAERGEPHMTLLKGDVHGSVLKRLGLPNQEYCWRQCLQEERCTAARWGVIAGDTAGQCMLISGELKFSELADLKTSDGKKILVTASKKEGSAPRGTADRTGY